MKILTTNHPIIVNGVKESKSSDYLSADGQALPDDYFSADGSDFYEARGRRRRWRKALNYIPAVAIANKLSNADGMTDVVSSKNPIIINGQDISNPSWYLSADGSRMSKARASNIEKRLAKLNREKANAQARIDKINSRVSASGKPMGRVDENIIRGLTKQVARIQATIDKLVAMQSSSFSGDDYYGMDADIYSYIDKKNTTDVKAFQTYANGKGAKLVVDGIWGAKTQAEYDKYGAEWEATKNPVSTAQVQNVVAQAPVVPQGQTPTATQVADAKKKGLFWDKVKGGWVYAKESGLLDWVGNLFGLKPPPAFQPTPPTATTTTTTTTTSDDSGKGMSKTTKTLLYVGGALVLGFVVYTIAKPKK